MAKGPETDAAGDHAVGLSLDLLARGILLLGVWDSEAPGFEHSAFNGPWNSSTIKRCIAMTKVEKLEREVRGLGPSELVAFRAWFRRFDADEWDRQIEHDVAEGKLDVLAHEATAEYRDGKTTEL